MQSQAKDVDAYLEEVPAERREVLTRLRDRRRQVLKGFEENMAYGNPGYSRQGVVEVGFASQKRYISFYILKQDALETQRAALTGLNVGKGCIGYSRPDQIDFAVVDKLLAAARDSQGPIC